MNLSTGLIFTLLLQLILAARYTQPLTKWTFKIESNPKEYPSITPSSLAWDLIDNKIVSNDPYFRDNFLQFYDYESKDAYYKTTFNVSATLINSQHQYLVFEGLDTHAEVYLNGQHILSAHNMFRRYEVDVKFKAVNELAVNFTSSVKYDLLKEKEFKD
jgi:beta-mannosidase